MIPISTAADPALAELIAIGAALYRREPMLARLIPIAPAALGDVSPAGRRQVLGRLAKALRGERRRGRAGHWSYSLDRHLALAQAYAAERRQLAELENRLSGP